METKIGRVKNYDMFYDPRQRLFILRNDVGEEVASGGTQVELEKRADDLAKQSFTFPIKAIQYSGPRHFSEGRVTSLNISEQAVWFCDDAEKGGYVYRGKKHLSYSHELFELTEHNAEIMRQIRDHQATFTALEEKIGALAKGLEKPIDLKYFGLSQ